MKEGARVQIVHRLQGASNRLMNLFAPSLAALVLILSHSLSISLSPSAAASQLTQWQTT